MADDGAIGALPPIDEDERTTHRMVRLATFATEGAVTLACWGVVARALGPPVAVTLVGVLVVPFVALVVCDALLGGSPVRRLAGLRVVDVGSGRPPTPARAAAREGGRLLTLAVVDTLVAGGVARSHDRRQLRWSHTAVVGRPTAARLVAVAGLAAGVAVLAWAVLAGADAATPDGAWRVPLVVALPLGGLGALAAFPAVIGLASLRPPPGDRVSLLSITGEWAGIDSDISLGLTGVRVAGSLDARPVPRPRADGTVADEVLESDTGVVTRKRRQVGHAGGR